MTNAWSKTISKKAIEIVMYYEQNAGRKPVLRDKAGVGYDIESKNKSEHRYIEVKGVSENWSTYTWQPLYASEVACLENNPDKFYLYIVYFTLPENSRNQGSIEQATHNIYIISGKEIKEEFAIKPANFQLAPISRSKLEKYKIRSDCIA